MQQLNNEKESKAKYQAKLGNGENSSWAVSKLTREKKIKNSPLEVYKQTEKISTH